MCSHLPAAKRDPLTPPRSLGVRQLGLGDGVRVLEIGDGLVRTHVVLLLHAAPSASFDREEVVAPFNFVGPIQAVHPVSKGVSRSTGRSQPVTTMRRMWGVSDTQDDGVVATREGGIGKN